LPNRESQRSVFGLEFSISKFSWAGIWRPPGKTLVGLIPLAGGSRRPIRLPTHFNEPCSLLEIVAEFRQPSGRCTARRQAKG